jgi:hypothetical protein
MDMDKARDMEMRIDIDIDVHMDMDMDTKNGLLVFLGQVIFFKNSDYWILVKILIHPVPSDILFSPTADVPILCRLSPISCHGCD